MDLEKRVQQLEATLSNVTMVLNVLQMTLKRLQELDVIKADDLKLAELYALEAQMTAWQEIATKNLVRASSSSGVKDEVIKQMSAEKQEVDKRLEQVKQDIVGLKLNLAKGKNNEN